MSYGVGISPTKQVVLQEAGQEERLRLAEQVLSEVEELGLLCLGLQVQAEKRSLRYTGRTHWTGTGYCSPFSHQT